MAYTGTWTNNNSEYLINLVNVCKYWITVNYVHLSTTLSSAIEQLKLILRNDYAISLSLENVLDRSMSSAYLHFAQVS